MDFELTFRTILEKFAKEKIQHALIGGFAVHAAGYQRATNDVDFLIAQESAPKAKQIVLALGYEVTHENKNFANFWHPMRPLGIVDFMYAHRLYTQDMLKRATIKEVLNGQFKVKVVIPEDIIGLKVQAIANQPGRYSKDWSDIEAIVERNKALDFDLIKEYFSLFGRSEDWQQLLKRISNA